MQAHNTCTECTSHLHSCTALQPHGYTLLCAFWLLHASLCLSACLPVPCIAHPQHLTQDLDKAHRMLAQQLQLVTDDELQQFGINPTATNMSDKEYAANMLELAARRR